VKGKTAILLLCLIAFGVYFPVLFNGFVGDDFLQIVQNTDVHSVKNFLHFFASSTYESGGAEGVAGIFYRPVMMVSFALIYHFFGATPLPYHLLQLIVHIANGILLYWFLRRFFSSMWAFGVGLIFLIHPINSEAVVYSANLQDVLFFFFGMVGMNILRKKRANVWLVSLFFLLSLFSKESGVLFLLISSLYCWLFMREHFRSRILLNGAVLVLYLFLRYGVARMYLNHGAVVPIYSAPLWERLLNIPAIVVYYMKTFFWPFSLGVEQFWLIRSVGVGDFFFPLLICLGLLGLLVMGARYLWRLKRKLFSSYLFFCCWFAIGLVLHLQLIPLDATVADRWFYFPIVGVLGLFSSFIPRGQVRWLRLGIVCLVLILGTFSLLRVLQWRDELTLYSHDIQVTPRNFLLDNSYASALITAGYFEEAKAYVISSIKGHRYSANLNNMGIILVSEKHYKEAKQYFWEATTINKSYRVHENYSSFLLVYGDLDEAYSFTKSALQDFPASGRLWLNMAKIFYLRGEKKEALQSAERAYKILGSEESKEIYLRLKAGKSIQVRKVR
jgi:tetratricopeptide (TPR) repeat protein